MVFRVPRVDDPMQFLNLSFEYYLSGRFAAINRLRIAPNLMHHAVELLINAGIPTEQRRARSSGSVQT